MPTDSSATFEAGVAGRPGRFLTTHWSVVLAAGDARSAQSAEALEKLCRAYWYPLYVYVRKRGYSPADAEDLTQEFFGRLLERNYLSTADRRKGRLRSFLLGALNHFLANEWDKAKSLKRGGRVNFISLDAEMNNGAPSLVIPDLSAEKTFERLWAVEVLDQAFNRLREECRRADKLDLFDRLKAFLTGEPAEGEYASVASALGWTQTAVAVAVHRLRRRYREVLLEEVAQTVATADEVQDELRQVLAAVAGTEV